MFCNGSVLSLYGQGVFFRFLVRVPVRLCWVLLVVSCFYGVLMRNSVLVGQTYESGSPSVEKQVHLSRDRIEDTIDADGVSVVNPSKSGSSIVQESSMPNLDEISPEAASFGQLQLVMEWVWHLFFL